MRTEILMRLHCAIVREGLIGIRMLLLALVEGQEEMRIGRGVIIDGMSSGGLGVGVRSESATGRGMGGIEMMWRGGRG
jgi:hypothetical protein